MDYEKDDWGSAIFVIERDGRRVPTRCHGFIKIVEEIYLLFEDHNGTPYLIERQNFKFKKKKFKNLNAIT